jgi:hypothetical protein
MANLRMNCLEKVGTIAARATVIGAMSGMIPPCEVKVVLLGWVQDVSY